jgi:type IV secretory pathway VirB2 component (pilin)
MSQSVPFSFQAAKASWAAPLVASVLGFCVKSMMSGDTHRDPQTTQLIWIVVGVLAVVIVVSGLILGIAALFGIKQHGWRRILIPSIVGIALSSGYLYLLISTVLIVRSLAAERGIG